MKILYQCEKCKTIYETEREAKECETQEVPAPKFDIGHKFRNYEIRSKKLRNLRGKHIWCYDARRLTNESNIYQYGEFLESEIEEYK